MALQSFAGPWAWDVKPSVTSSWSGGKSKGPDAVQLAAFWAQGAGACHSEASTAWKGCSASDWHQGAGSCFVETWRNPTPAAELDAGPNAVLSASTGTPPVLLRAKARAKNPTRKRSRKAPTPEKVPGATGLGNSTLEVKSVTAKEAEGRGKVLEDVRLSSADVAEVFQLPRALQPKDLPVGLGVPPPKSKELIERLADVTKNKDAISVAAAAASTPEAAMDQAQKAKPPGLSLERAVEKKSGAASKEEQGGGTAVKGAGEESGTTAYYDFVVIGSGIAGLRFALDVAEKGTVAVVTKSERQEGSTNYAQGGVSAVLDPNDSVENHIRDTIVAGAYLNDEEVVEVVCREGPERVRELMAMGASFDKAEDGQLRLAREGGHSHHRIVHAADVTGREIERALLVAAQRNPNISIFEHHFVVDLLTEEVPDDGVVCHGADALDVRSGAVVRFLAGSTLLASGGAGHVYPSTTNPTVATGDGVALAQRAKAVISNMEFIQFHPTALADEGLPRPPASRPNAFLITEAVRGAGGILYNQSGERFMLEYDSRGELAPRDVVARSIDDQLKRRGEKFVWLDISHEPKEEIQSHFPNIAAECMRCGIDITVDPIPVVPAAHYMCGGVQTGLHGETSVKGLWAAGEVACTGLHGANRLASNSLLEALVFAQRAVEPSIAHALQRRAHRAQHSYSCSAPVSDTGPPGSEADLELAPEPAKLPAGSAPSGPGGRHTVLSELLPQSAPFLGFPEALPAALLPHFVGFTPELPNMPAGVKEGPRADASKEGLLAALPRACGVPRGDKRAVAAAQVSAKFRSRLQGIMWEYVGIVRSTERLHAAKQELCQLALDWQAELADHAELAEGTVTVEVCEMRNLVSVAQLIVKSALRRHESRGLHFTTDYPESVECLRLPTVLSPRPTRRAA